MEKLFNLFEEIGLPYYRQGSLSEKDYPPSFFTYWNIDTQNASFYDNKEHRYIPHIQVGFYTKKSAEVYTGMDDFVRRAKEKGFVCDGRPKDADSGKADYFGRVCLIRIMNKA